MTDPYVPRWSRRTTLQWLAASSLATSLPRWACARPGSIPAFSAGYGNDPNLKNPIVPWSRTLQPDQLRQAAVLADLILPATATAPAPSSVGVPEFIDEWVSAPYPDQLTDRVVILRGLERLDKEASLQGSRQFVELPDHAREGIVKRIAQRNVPTQALDPFFQRFRFLVVAAYYTTPEGWNDIRYLGNVPLSAYPPITGEERAKLDTALASLGITLAADVP